MLNKKEMYVNLGDISGKSSSSGWIGINHQSRKVQLSKDRGIRFFNQPILKSAAINGENGVGNKFILTVTKIILTFLAVIGSIFLLDSQIKKV